MEQNRNRANDACYFRRSLELKGAKSRYFSSVFASKTIVKLKEATKYTHVKIEKYYRCHNKQGRIEDG